MDMSEKETMEGSLQSCKGFVQSKRKLFSQVMHWKKTGVEKITETFFIFYFLFSESLDSGFLYFLFFFF